MPARDLNLRSLVELVAQLRSPQGCPWDRAQTHRTLTGLLLEEAYEVVEAIEAENASALKEELGDLLLHVAFHVQIAQEAGEFALDDVLASIYDKIIRRHPHVFGNRPSKEMVEIKAHWEALKRQEKAHGSASQKGGKSLLPALIAARKVLDRASNLGLPRRDKDVLKGLPKEANEQLVGRLLLQIVAWAREKGLEPEYCLQKATAQLAERIETHIETPNPKARRR